MGCSTEIRLLVHKYFFFFDLGAKFKHLAWYGEIGSRDYPQFPPCEFYKLVS